jgi:hypothetical protein
MGTGLSNHFLGQPTFLLPDGMLVSLILNGRNVHLQI